MTNQLPDPATLVLVEQDVIDQYDDIAEEFFKEILDMSVNNVLITDLSSLSDFSLSGPVPEDLLDETLPLRELNKTWDAWVLERIQGYYGFRPKQTTDTLVVLFSQIEESRRPATLH